MSYKAAGATHGALTAGQETFARLDTSSVGIAPASGQMYLSFWRARKSETATKFRLFSGSTAAVTPTLCRVGLYTVDATGNITLVASCANDTTLFAATFAKYQPPLSASYGVTLGTRYATGVLVLAATMPKFLGQFYATVDEGQAPPSQIAMVTGQTDLPASVAVGSLANVSGGIYSVLSP